MIDVSKIRVGDEVTVRAKVVDRGTHFSPCHDYPGEPTIRIMVGEWVGSSEIATHTPKPREFKPGDRVTWGKLQGTYVYEFIAQRGDCAVAWNDTFGFSLQPTSDLRHADESE